MCGWWFVMCWWGNFSAHAHPSSSARRFAKQIQRYYCHDCKQTFSILPEELSPRRWYAWDVHEQALLAWLLASTIRAISHKYQLARSTIRRWLARFQERFTAHADQLKQLFPEVLGRTTGFISFWTACLEQCSLAAAMWSLHHAKVAIP
jgi:transposase-like protein